jgi:hypothetical protein
MAGIDLALQLGYNPVKVKTASCVLYLFFGERNSTKLLIPQTINPMSSTKLLPVARSIQISKVQGMQMATLSSTDCTVINE